MPAPVQSLLNPSIGIADLMPMPAGERLPQARELSASVLQETGLEALYGAVNARTVVQGLICPSIGDGTLVNPEMFTSRLKSLQKKLRSGETAAGAASDPRVREMLEKELEPLLQNESLFVAYSNLMVGG